MLSAVIPVFNAAGCLGSIVPALSEILGSIAGEDWEILLVDDGSTDGTAEAIAALADGRRVRGLSHPVNRGKGAAVRTGMLASRGDVVLFTDADMSTPLDTLRVFLEALDEGADVVIGNRKSGEATIERWQPALRTWLGLGFTRLANGLLGLSISDYTCGFKVFRGPAARRIFAELKTERWSFDVEVLARAAAAGLVLRQIPVRWRHADDTRVRVARDVVRSFLELLDIRRRLGRIRA